MNLTRKIRILENYADIIQIDIMDNGLVPNISIEIDEIHKVKPKSKLENASDGKKAN